LLLSIGETTGEVIVSASRVLPAAEVPVGLLTELPLEGSVVSCTRSAGGILSVTGAEVLLTIGLVTAGASVWLVLSLVGGVIVSADAGEVGAGVLGIKGSRMLAGAILITSMVECAVSTPTGVHVLTGTGDGVVLDVATIISVSIDKL